MSYGANLAYSPTQTSNYSICPLKWVLSYKHKGTGLIAPYNTNRVASMLAGAGVQAGLTTWFSQRGNFPTDELIEASVQQGLQEVERRRDEFATEALYAYDLPDLFDVQNEVSRSITGYCNEYPDDPWEILGCEVEFTVPSHCIADMMIRDVDGEIAVFERKLLSKWAKQEKVMAAYRMNYQVYHYCWAASLAYGTPVRRVIMDYIHRTAKPTFERDVIEINERLLQQHMVSAQDKWLRMKELEETVHPGWEVYSALSNWEACDTRYGRCEFFDLCKSGWDENVEAKFYRIKPPKVIIEGGEVE